MRKRLAALALAAIAGIGSTAHAAPVVRPAILTMNISLAGLPPIMFASAGSVTVDDALGTIMLAAGAVSLPAPVVIPVTATTAIAQLSATTISNLAGTFSFGGGIAPPLSGEVCPPTLGQACVVGSGLGGPMGLTGVINVAIIPMVVVIPVSLNAAGIGQGGSTATPFTFDAAPWTTSVGSVALPTTGGGTSTVVISGTTSSAASQLTLVTPTFVSALNNLLPVFTSFTISFTDGLGLPAFMVPEPGTWLLLGSGLAGLILAGSRRR